VIRRGLGGVLVCMAVFSTSASPDTISGDEPEAPGRAYGQNYKDMLLSMCIARAYSADKAASNDARSTASAFVEWTNYDAEKATSEIDRLLANYLKREYRNPLVEYKGVRFELLKCLDMYHSKELDAQVKRFVPKPTHSHRRDHPTAR
jgi:hypothetical protein